jgi:tRNA(Ile)-lysidine synthase
MNDQAETFLLQLLRGAGAAGLASMPPLSDFGEGYHCRPLLDFSREQILTYAHTHTLRWVEDPSNQDVSFDRNFLRNQIFPDLRQRWPAIDRTLLLAANQQSENQHLLEVLAEIDLADIPVTSSQLPLEVLSALSEDRLRNLLRYWISSHQVTPPSREIVKQIIAQVLHSASDARPVICWAGVEIRRFQQQIYLVDAVDHDPGQRLQWDPRKDLYIESLKGVLRMQQSDKKGLSSSILEQALEVRFRQGGEKIQPVGRQGHHSLKNLFQEAGVPPWLRDRTPLLYLGEELVAVVGYWIAEAYAPTRGETAYWPEFQPNQR